ncbi:hypothetical protein SH668x_000174 [Planctomicrobium sp. SH668]|uniref:hypothetical protein n=1 Tax=Planctomicrobium sp. SH668 TaxID=3448126 RepID=UPI003F5B7E2D
MRSKLLRGSQIWGCAFALSWTNIGLGQEAPPAAVSPADDPLVVKPKNAEEKFDAVLLMLKLARLDLAKYYLQQTLEENPSDETLLAIREKHGTATFLQLTSVAELNPGAITLLERLNEAIRNRSAQPGYVEAILQKLEGSTRERAESLAELKHLGPYAVPAILKSIANRENASVETLTLTLVQLGRAANQPLYGGLTSPVAEVRSVAAKVLGHTGSSADTIWLWAPAFSDQSPTGVQQAAKEAIARLRYGDAAAVNRVTSDGASRVLVSKATELLNGQFKWPELYDDVELIPVWTWSDEAGTIVEHPVNRTLAGIFFAERFARNAVQISPEQQQAQVVLLASLLARDVELNQWKLPHPQTDDGVLGLAVRSGAELNSLVLRFALDNHIPSAALRSLQALSLNGSTSLLSSDSQRSAVIDALDAADSRVQFAAAVTILNWEPTRRFRNSRRVVEILSRVLNSQATPASVVMDPNVTRGNATAGIFTQLGLDAGHVRSGKEGFKVASERGDIVLAVVHPNVVGWELTDTIKNLRADSRTASIPIVIYGPANIHDKFDRISKDFQRVVYVDEANVPLDIHRTLGPILAQLSPPALTAVQRQEQILEASSWLRRIAIRNVNDVFDLAPAEEALSHAVADPKLAENALVTLGAIGTATVQEQLLLTATSAAFPIETRRLAASQLTFHVHQYGLLLSKGKLSGLKSAQENEADPELKVALESVIGALKPTPGAVREELLKFPASPSPVGN